MIDSEREALLMLCADVGRRDFGAYVAYLRYTDGTMRMITAEEFFLDRDSTQGTAEALFSIVQDPDRFDVDATTRIINLRELKGPVLKEDRVERPPYFQPDVPHWHRRTPRVCQLYVNWHTNRRNPLLPRGRCRRWRSLKERRQAWGFA